MAATPRRVRVELSPHEAGIVRWALDHVEDCWDGWREDGSVERDEHLPELLVRGRAGVEFPLTWEPKRGEHYVLVIDERTEPCLREDVVRFVEMYYDQPRSERRPADLRAAHSLLPRLRVHAPAQEK